MKTRIADELISQAHKSLWRAIDLIDEDRANNTRLHGWWYEEARKALIEATDKIATFPSVEDAYEKE